MNTNSSVMSFSSIREIFSVYWRDEKVADVDYTPSKTTAKVYTKDPGKIPFIDGADSYQIALFIESRCWGKDGLI
ncbi:MAG TPA: hypothetical protein GXX75_07835 [Clostridiales bacterium]|nr:hypothetical protein [Clostridiales bacterium]